MVISVRLQIDPDPKYAFRFAPLLAVAPQLQAFGVHLTQDCERYDLQIAQVSRMQHNAEDFLSDRCSIVFERSDAATLDDNKFHRTLIQDPRIRIWVKEFAFRDPELHNAPVVDGRYHFSLLQDDGEAQGLRLPKIVVPVSDLAKIRTLLPVYAYSILDSARALKRQPLSARRCGLFYAGLMEYKQTILNRHRQAAFDAVVGMKAVARLVGYGRVFQRRNFQQMLNETKIFLSPFGLGEFSWKDYEAIYAGCIVVKPRADFVTTYGYDIYGDHRYCIPCEPNFADLPGIVDRILSNEAEFQDFVDVARNDLLRAAELENYAADVAEVIQYAAAL